MRALRRGHHQELVGSVPAQNGLFGQLGAQDAGDFLERPIARAVAVGVVQETEVIDVHERDADRADRLRVGPPGLELGRQLGHDRAVVQQAGQCIAPRGLDELGGLPVQAPLSGTEDEVQQDRQQGRCTHRHDDRVAPCRVDARQHGGCVPVDLEHGHDVTADHDRQVFLQDGRHPE